MLRTPNVYLKPANGFLLYKLDSLWQSSIFHCAFHFKNELGVHLNGHIKNNIPPVNLNTKMAEKVAIHSAITSQYQQLANVVYD